MLTGLSINTKENDIKEFFKAQGIQISNIRPPNKNDKSPFSFVDLGSEEA